MKNLKDVLEKLKVDDITPDEVFPIEGTYEEVFNFLKNHNFIPLESKHASISKLFNKERDKCMRYNKNIRIWFADTSKGEISKDNPVFLINFYNNAIVIYYTEKENPNRAIYTFDSYRTNNDKKAFIEELNKHFDWE